MGGKTLDVSRLWKLYQSGLSYEQIGHHFGVSSSTIKRRLRGVRESYSPPQFSRGAIHLDVTYWGRNQGLMVALDAKSGVVLYHKWIAHERKQDYIDALDSISGRGYKIEAIVLDGGVGLDICKQLYPVQMCQYHFISIVRHKLTFVQSCQRPKSF